MTTTTRRSVLKLLGIGVGTTALRAAVPLPSATQTPTKPAKRSTLYFNLDDAEVVAFAPMKAKVLRMRAARDAGDNSAYNEAKAWSPTNAEVLSWFPTAERRVVCGRQVLTVSWDDYMRGIEVAARG